VSIQLLDFYPKTPNHLDHTKNVRQLGDVAENTGFFGEQRRRDERETGILGTADRNASAQRLPAPYASIMHTHFTEILLKFSRRCPLVARPAVALIFPMDILGCV
jgi:hypothetical protein